MRKHSESGRSVVVGQIDMNTRSIDITRPVSALSSATLEQPTSFVGEMTLRVPLNQLNNLG